MCLFVNAGTLMDSSVALGTPLPAGDDSYQAGYQEPRQTITSTSINDRLPPEMLAKIFDTFLESYLSQIDSPWKLGAVCRMWREIAWSTPVLWSTLVLQYSRRPRNLSAARIELAMDWIGRSGCLPLSITIDYPLHNIFRNHRFETLSNQVHRKLCDLMELVNSNAARWKYLHLHLPGDVLSLLDARSADGSSLLHTLSLRSCDVGGKVTINNISKLSPKVVEISAIPLRRLDFNWQLVTQLSMKARSIEDVSQALEFAPALRHCAFRPVFNSSRRTEPRKITHSSVTSLEIGPYLGLHNGEDFFRAVNLPALDTLTLREIPHRDLPLDDCQRFLSRSRNGLKTLKVELCSLSGDQIAHLGRVTTSIECLHITSDLEKEDLLPVQLESFYAALRCLPQSDDIEPESATPVFPLLREFHRTKTGEFYWEQEELTALLEPLSLDSTRRRPLELIKLHCRRYTKEPYLSRQVLDQLSRFADQVNFDFTVELDNGMIGDLWALSQLHEFE
ncbi:hypothetical protein CVT26_015314 [Gymnopilus dilepis]|uniref:F-box domain-containing protein n=1 Tax=Gymnopilus dilepis TaxID=231916 RepID=A0A409W4B9_9AGAR|nr:hypothetical protein CVT26_015314 [Gymnopilus dilepis]